jgi:hypothetical protein
MMTPEDLTPEALAERQHNEELLADAMGHIDAPIASQLAFGVANGLSRKEMAERFDGPWGVAVRHRKLEQRQPDEAS